VAGWEAGGRRGCTHHPALASFIRDALAAENQVYQHLLLPLRVSQPVLQGLKLSLNSKLLDPSETR